MDKLNITNRQKKMLIIIGIVGTAFVIFIVAIYLPMRRHFITIKKEHDKIEAEVSEIRRLSGAEKSIEEAIRLLKNKLDTLERKFPDKEEGVLRELPSLAAKLGIEVTSLKPQKKRDIKELNGRPVDIKDCYAQEMPVSMSLRAPYKTLGDFFRILNMDFPIFIRVDSVRFERTSSASSSNILNANVDLNAYLICQK